MLAQFGCDGEKKLPEAVFQFTNIVIQVHGQFYHVRGLKILEGIDVSAVFQTKLFVSYVNVFLGSKISPLHSGANYDLARINGW